MKLRIIGKNKEISPEISQYLEKKLRKLDRHLPNIFEGVVEISQEMTKDPEKRYVVQITLTHSGTVLRDEQRAADIHSAIDSAIDVMDRRIERYKGKLYRKGRGEKPLPSKGPEEIEIVREKRFLLTSLSVEQAVEQMELLGHDFFLFINAETGLYSLVYRRRGGNYGLIESELP